MVHDQDNTLWLNYLLLFKNSVYCIIVSKGSNSSLAKLWHMFSCYHFFFLGGIYGRPYAIRPTQPNYCSHPNTTTLLISSCSISVIINTFFITTNHHHHHHHKHLSLSLSLSLSHNWQFVSTFIFLFLNWKYFMFELVLGKPRSLQHESLLSNFFSV